MSKTRHIKVRMNQRAIDQTIIDLTLSFGATQIRGDIKRYLLTKKSLDITLRRLDKLRSKLLRVKDKGGVALIATKSGLEITTYNLIK